MLINLKRWNCANVYVIITGIEPEKGTADSGDLESDLAQVFIALREAAQDRNTAVAIIIDELQYLSDEELTSLIMAVNKISQRSLPVVLVGAGLPQLVGKAGRAKSYAERLFDYPKLGPLKNADAKIALQEPVQKEGDGVSFTDEALNEIIRVTQGYPYFLQEWGYQAWNLATKSPIDVDVAK
jgi:type II secretory pathway predicted ATPase ExeA